MNWLHRSILCAWLLVPVASLAQGEIKWGWRYNQTHFVVGPSDSILITGTFYLRPDSAPVTIEGVGGSWGGDLQKIYTYQPNWQTLYHELQRTFLPGQSASFVLGPLVPNRLPIAEGTYHADPSDIGFTIGARQYNAAPDNTFSIQVVPEPSTKVVLILGAALLLLWTPGLFRGGGTSAE